MVESEKEKAQKVVALNHEIETARLRIRRLQAKIRELEKGEQNAASIRFISLLQERIDSAEKSMEVAAREILLRTGYPRTPPTAPAKRKPGRPPKTSAR